MKVHRLLMGVSGIAGLSLAFAHPSDDQANAAHGYSHWTQATKNPVKISPKIWSLCRPPTPAQQKALDEFNRQNPHSNGFMRVYANELAKKPLLKGGLFPTGSILVKEKMIGPDTGLIARMVMRKHEKSWNVKTDGWEFYVLGKNMQPETADTSACVSCHTSQAKTGWVYRTYLPPSARR